LIQLGELKLELGTMLWQLIVFLVLIWLVAKFAMKPAMKVLNDRQNYIHTQITDAEKANQESARLIEEQRKILADAKKEAYDIIEQAKQQKDREGVQIIKEAQERAERLIKDAVAEIDNEKNRAIAELRDQVGTLSILLASKIIEKEMNAQDNAHIIDEFLKQAEGRI
jgi:F-type H+-transporting ATPase subunit b